MVVIHSNDLLHAVEELEQILGKHSVSDRLRGEVSAEQYFTTLPGIGPELSHRLHE